MDLPTIQEGWNQAAREGAMANILTDMSRGPEAFFAHGRIEIDQAVQRMNTLGLHSGKGRALDFGCGVGRLTQALAAHYRRADGVDVSDEMIEQANALNDNSRVRYHHNPASDLGLFRAGSFDFVYSMIVLQHMPQELQHGYITEFFRVLKPGGVAMFEIPDGPDTLHPARWLSMYGVPQATVEGWVADAGGRLVDVETLDEPSMWQCRVYTATR